MFLVRFWHDKVPKIEREISAYSVFPSVYVQVRQWGAWKLHPVYSCYPEIILYMLNLAQIPNFEATIVFFCVVLLVISTMSMVSTVSSQTSKHFYSFPHCPHHTRLARIVAYHSNTHCPYLSKPKVCVTYFTFSLMVVMPLLPPSDPLGP